MSKTYELKSSDLRYFCDPKIFKFKSTDDIGPLDEVIGQERAVQAIEFGLGMKSSGYNIFVTGIEGTGKSTITTDITRKHAKTLPIPKDWCMVNNFQDPYRPKPLAVPSGKGSYLGRQMDRMIQALKIKLPKAFDDTSFQDKIGVIQDGFQKQEAEHFQKLDKAAQERKLGINKTGTGLADHTIEGWKTLDARGLSEALKESAGKDRVSGPVFPGRNRSGSQGSRKDPAGAGKSRGSADERDRVVSGR